ncbi:MAG: formimidoylglutamate deiminase [Cyclobacteriaceae bacterium]
MKFAFKGILTEVGWMENAVLTTDKNGIVTSIEQEPSRADYMGAYLLPGFQNAHSHAFQFAMAGLAENHSTSDHADNFWSWRKAMYDIALTVTPDEMQEIAEILYTEMVRNGYTSVAEFHYLHHDPEGKPYQNLAEMGERLMLAAQSAGIRITLIPMFYQQGSFGKAAESGQRRFISPDAESYHRLLEATKHAAKQYSNARVGVGIHSLRAVSAPDIIGFTQQLDGSVPFHIHIAEQLKEVEDCLSFHGKRPVEWLLDNCDVGPHFHLVHATHLSDQEVNGIAKSGAHVVLCPSTEGNLGDGLFSFHDFKKAGGRWSIGTDSHIGLNPFEELRLLDYGQRLITHRRDTFKTEESGDSGINAIKMAWRAGRAAMGNHNQHFFEVGKPLDAVVISDQSPLIQSSATDHLSNTIVYTASQGDIENTIINGQIISNEIITGPPGLQRFRIT